MNLNLGDPVSTIVSAADDVLDRVLPDKDLEIKNQAQNNLMQLQVDDDEAKQPWILGQWRDALGWVCVLAFIWQYVLQPIITYFTSLILGHPPALPQTDVSQLTTLLLGMLGMSGFHAYQQIQTKK